MTIYIDKPVNCLRSHIQLLKPNEQRKPRKSLTRLNIDNYVIIIIIIYYIIININCS